MARLKGENMPATTDLARKVTLCNLTDLPVRDGELPELRAIWRSDGDAARRIMAWRLQTGAGCRFFFDRKPTDRRRNPDRGGLRMRDIPGVGVADVNVVLDLLIESCTE